MSKDIVAKVFVVWQNTVLLIRRSSTDQSRAGKWDIPGGEVEFSRSEQIGDGCIRETLEEAGLQLLPSQLKEIPGLDDLQQQHVERHVYVAELSLQEEPIVRLSHEHSAYQWEPVGNTAKLLGHHFYSVAWERYLCARNH